MSSSSSATATTTTADTATTATTTSKSNRKVLVVLVSNGVSNLNQASNQRKTRTILDAKHIPYVEVDGMLPEHRESRDELFAISGIRGNYPQ